jgi:hypothetical protein
VGWLRPSDLAGSAAFHTLPWEWASMVQKRKREAEGMLMSEDRLKWRLVDTYFYDLDPTERYGDGRLQ